MASPLLFQNNQSSQASSSSNPLIFGGDSAKKPAIFSPPAAKVTQVSTPPVKKGFLQDVGDSLKAGVASFIAGLPALKGTVKTGIGVALDAISPDKEKDTKKGVEHFEKLLKDLEKDVSEKKTTKIGLIGSKRVDADEQQIQDKKKAMEVIKGSIAELKKGNAPVTQAIKKSGIEDQNKSQQNKQKVEEQYGPAKPWSGDWFLREVMYNAPQFLGSFGLGVATAIATKNPSVGIQVGLGSSFVQESGAAYKTAKDAGQSEGTSQKIATTVGAVNAAIEQLPLGQYLNKISKGTQIKQGIVKRVTEILISRAEQGVLEGTTETLQEFISNALERTYNKDKKLFEGLPESGAIGLLLGMLAPTDINTKFTVEEDVVTPDSTIPGETKDTETSAIQNVQRYIQTPAAKLEPSTVEYLTQNKIGVDELPFKDGKITVYREGEITPGKPTSFSLDQTSGQKPYTLTKDEVILNTNSEKLVEAYNKSFDANTAPGMVDALKKFNGLESEIIAIPNEQKATKETISSVVPQEVKVPNTQLPVGKGDEKVSKLAERTRGTLENLTQEERAKLPTYKQASDKQQLEDAAEYAINKPDDALAVLRGEKSPPKGLLYNSVYLAMREKAKSDGNIKLITDLASLQSTRFGQEISILRNADPFDPTALVQQAEDYKIQGYEKRTGKKVNKVIKDETRVIKESTPKVDKYSWSNFLVEIEC